MAISQLTLLQSIVTGLLIGGIYIIISIGLDVLAGVLNITNFAHGDLVAFAMYLTYFAHNFLHLNVAQMIVFIPIAFAVLGIPLYYGIFKRMVNQPYSTQLLYTSALSIALQNSFLVAFRWDPRDIGIPLRMESINLGPILVNKLLALAFIVSVITTILVFTFLYKTERGVLIRATISNRELLSLLGIDPYNIYLQAFCLAMALTGLGSVFLMYYFPVTPTTGILYTTLMFVAIVLGGIGTIKGCIIGGLIIGLTQIVSSTLFFVNFQNIAVFILFIFIVIFRPRGLLGEITRGERAGG